MGLNFLKTSEQVRGVYDSAKVRERKTVSVESSIKGNSNLFFIGQMWSEQGGTVEVSSRKGFEVISYVVTGSVQHTNNLSADTHELGAGAVQVIRASSGISHTDVLAANTEVVHVWLDPDFRKSLQRQAGHVIYDAEDFETETYQGMPRIDLTGDESPLWFSTNAELEVIEFGANEFSVSVAKEHFLSAIVLEGELEVDGETLDKCGFFMAEKVSNIQLKGLKPGKLFLVRNPEKVSYKTYNEQLQLST
ncbi:MAG: pirin family protein [Bacteroidota bacterium]